MAFRDVYPKPSGIWKDLLVAYFLSYRPKEDCESQQGDEGCV